MNTSSNVDAVTLSTPIPLPWRTLLRGIWIVLVLLVTGLYMLSLPEAAAYTRSTACTKYAAPLGIGSDLCTMYLTGLSVVTTLCYLAICAIIFIFKSHERVGWLAATSLALFGIASQDVFAALSERHSELSFLVQMVIALAFFAFVTFFYLFPDGHFQPRWFRYVAIAYGLWSVGAWLLSPRSFAQFDNPLLLTMIAFWLATALYSQIYRYRNCSTPNQKQQTKWIVYGAALALILFVPSIPLLPFAVHRLVAPDRTLSDLLLFVLSITIRYACVTIIPVVFAISIFHFRLWQIDLVINRTLVFGTLTAALAIVFILVVLVVQQLATLVTGGQQSSLAVAAATLAVAVLFQPARMRLRAFIDKRFYPRYLAQANDAVYTPELIPAGDYGPLTGQQIGPYWVLETIGHGGMADIYKGRHVSMDRFVAIKTLTAGSDQEQRFEREANMIAKLRHPNIVQLYDFGRLGNLHYMIMEYIAGQDLQKYLREHGKLRLEEARLIARDIASALDYAHEQGLVHRDVKPSNVMLQPLTATSHGDTPESPFRAILTDFGIAKLADSSGGFTRTGMVGTLDYVAPEQIVSAKTVDYRADVYSFGIMLFQMLTGVLPFQNENVAGLLMAHLQKQAPDPRLLVPELSPAIAKALVRAMEKEPVLRQSSAGEVVAALWR